MSAHLLRNTLRRACRKPTPRACPSTLCARALAHAFGAASPPLSVAWHAHWHLQDGVSEDSSSGPCHSNGHDPQICFDFTKGLCTRGDKCKYSHDIATIVQFNSKEKGICFDYLRNQCHRGLLCRFSHDLSNIAQQCQVSSWAMCARAPVSCAVGARCLCEPASRVCVHGVRARSLLSWTAACKEAGVLCVSR